MELFTDAKSGWWAGVTTIFCVAVVGAGNLLLLAATLGQRAPNNQHWDVGNLMTWVIFVGLAVGSIIGLLRFILPVKPWREMKDGWVTALGAAGIGFLSSGVIVGVLYVIAWRSAVGDQPFAWQPVVGFTMSVVAVASFGGYHLASRRSRVGFAASFVMTFLVLLSFMLTLDGLARAADGTSTQDAAAQGAARAVQDLLTDFRGSVALIVGFYFGTDAAVSVAKMFRTTGRDAAQISRLDRDLAVPPQ